MSEGTGFTASDNLVRPLATSRQVYDKGTIDLAKGISVARTPGAKNRTPRELEAEARRLLEKAKHMREIEKLKKR